MFYHPVDLLAQLCGIQRVDRFAQKGSATLGKGRPEPCGGIPTERKAAVIPKRFEILCEIIAQDTQRQMAELNAPQFGVLADPEPETTADLVKSPGLVVDGRTTTFRDVNETKLL
ncbi:hypothetical protein N5A93_01500 [Roseovarius sp. EGI FJ00037]|nr:hypothetical protein [Roseovarius sp. EGI FJ00037]